MNEMELQTTLDPIEMDMGDPEIEYSPVLPNPEGEPTDDLTKVTIQGNIYQIKDPEVHDWARAEEKPTYTKAEVGLGNVDNTSDMDKPVSTATQTALDGKVDNSELGNYYTKSEVNSALDNKADKSDTYTKTETNNLLSEKADSSSVYTKTETDTALGNKVDKVTGKGLSTNDYDNTAKGIVDGVTSALDGKADKSDTYTKSEVNSALDNKVDKVNGKGLSENDFTDTLKDKLDGIEAEANRTIVDNSVTATSTNPVESKAIYNMLNDLLPEAEETGNPISITNASGLNAKSLKVELEPVQDLHGYDKPWAGGSGKNKIDIANGTGATTRGVLPSYDNNGGLNFMGTPTGTGYIGNWTLTNPLVLPAGTYTISFSESIDKPFILLDNWTSIAYIPSGNNSYTLNFANGVSINRIALNASSGDVDVPLSINIGKIQIEAGSSATSYEPYSNICPIIGRTQTTVSVNSEDTTIQFGQTVYGGEVDVTSGGTSSTFAFHELDGTENNWEYYSVAQGSLFRIALNDKPRTPELINISPYCNSYNPVAQGNRTNGTVSSSVNSYSVDFIDNRFTTLADWKSHLRNAHIQIAYLKETPTTLTTPATPISLNKGNNTLSTSGDNMDLKYSKILQ